MRYRFIAKSCGAVEMNLYGTSLQRKDVAYTNVYAYICINFRNSRNKRLFLDGKNQGRDFGGDDI